MDNEPSWSLANFILLAIFTLIMVFSTYQSYRIFKQTKTLVTSSIDDFEDAKNETKPKIDKAVKSISSMDKTVNGLRSTLTRVRDIVPRVASLVKTLQNNTKGVDMREALEQTQGALSKITPQIKYLYPKVKKFQGVNVRKYFDNAYTAVQDTLDIMPDIKRISGTIQNETIPEIMEAKKDVRETVNTVKKVKTTLPKIKSFVSVANTLATKKRQIEEAAREAKRVAEETAREAAKAAERAASAVQDLIPDWSPW